MTVSIERTVPMGSLRDLVSLAKPRITLMVLVTTAGGMWLAPGHRSGLIVAITLLTTAAVVPPPTRSTATSSATPIA